MRSNAAQDPDAARKKILLAFSELNVTAEMLAAYLGHPVAQSSPAEIADLRAVYKSISDGNTTWGDYVNGNSEATAADLKQKTEAKAAELKEKIAGKAAAKAEDQPFDEEAEKKKLRAKIRDLYTKEQITEALKTHAGNKKLDVVSLDELNAINEALLQL